MFSAEFSHHWPADQDDVPFSAASERDETSLSPSQLEALEELVDRVNAARSIL